MRSSRFLFVILIVLLVASAVRGDEKISPREEIRQLLKRYWLYFDKTESKNCTAAIRTPPAIVPENPKKQTLPPICVAKDPYMTFRAARSVPPDIAAPHIVPLNTRHAVFITITMRNIPGKKLINNYFQSLFASLSDKNQRVAGYVMDLNQNVGGMVSGAEAVLSHFAPVQKNETTLLFEVRERNGAKTRHIAITPGEAANTCVAVLANEETASAAETIAYVLQLWGAHVIGKPTFKKGIVQTPYSLSNGMRLKFTTGRIFYADGTTTHRYGVIPNYITDSWSAQWKEARAYLRRCYAAKQAGGHNTQPLTPKIIHAASAHR